MRRSSLLRSALRHQKDICGTTQMPAYLASTNVGHYFSVEDYKFSARSHCNSNNFNVNAFSTPEGLHTTMPGNPHLRERCCMPDHSTCWSFGRARSRLQPQTVSHMHCDFLPTRITF